MLSAAGMNGPKPLPGEEEDGFEEESSVAQECAATVESE